MVTTWANVWGAAGSGQPFDLGQLIPVFGVSVVFIYACWMLLKDLKAANAGRLADEQAHSKQLLDLIHKLAPLLKDSTETLEAMQKGAAHVAEQVASTSGQEIKALRADLKAVLDSLDNTGG